MTLRDSFGNEADADSNIAWSEPEVLTSSTPLQTESNSLMLLTKLGYAFIDAVQTQAYPIGEVY